MSARPRDQEHLAEEQARLDELNQVLGSLPAADLPIVLLPVRLETRYVASGAEFDLCVRVYPDDVHVETHEPELLEAEQMYGRHFWEQIWRAGGDEARRKAAWAQLAERCDPQRAAWVARATKPTNPQDRLAGPVSDDRPLPVAPRFAEATLHQESWTRAPVVRTLPDRWVVFGYRDGQRAIVRWSVAIPDELAAGPSPAATEQIVGDDQLPLDPGMRWLVDFEEAVRVGMGLRIRLSSGDAQRGFDELVVVGVRASLNGEAAASRLAELLESQRYTDGLAFVAPGTPTNNTPNAPSGFRSQDPGFEESYGTEIATDDGMPGPLDNATVLARALGITAAPVSGIVGAREPEQANVRAMHTALWPATWGYFLDQVLDKTVPLDRVNVIRQLFVEHVRGRGPLPALRIGRQPYGMLPALSLDRWTADRDPVRLTLITVLRALRNRWRAVVARVPRVGGADTLDRADADLLELLAIEPVSTAFQTRSVVDALVFGTPQLPLLPNALPADVAQRRQAAGAALKELGVTGGPRALDFVFLQDTSVFRGPLVQGGALDRIVSLHPDYIRWLRDADVASIRKELYPPELTRSGKPGALLFLLLRHSTLYALVDEAHRAQIGGGGTSRGTRPDPTLIGVLDVAGVPTWDDYDRLTTSNHPAAAALIEFRAALTHLSGRGVADLERLLPETLDCCAHRLDAWITALASERLSKLRDARPTGVLIGAYGWVQNVKPNTSRQPVQPPPGEAGPMVQQERSGGFVHAPSLNQAATAAVLRSGYLPNRGADQPFAIDLSSQRVRRAQWLLDGVRQGQPLTALLGYRFERGLHENHPGLELDEFIEEFRKLAPLSEIYQARAERDDARANEASHREDAKAKQDQATQLETRAMQELTGLRDSRARVASALKAAERDVSRFEEEIQKLLRPVFPPDPDREARLAALRMALKAAQSRVSSSQTQLTRLDKQQIPAAENAHAQAVADAAKLNKEASDLISLADKEGKRALEASAREQDLLARRRDALLLPPASGMETQESIAVENVVDGLALHKKYRKALESASGPRWDEDTIPFGKVRPGKLPLPADGTAKFRAIVEELAILDDSIDAVSDAVTAESVHQALLGNPMRVGATLEAVAGGETPPPELDLVRTPRTGTAVTHRLALVLPESPLAGDTWPTDGHQVREAVEPRLNAWAAPLLGDPRRILCRAEYRVDDAVVGTRDVSLDSLALSPLDLLWMAGAGRRGSAGVLEERLRYESLRNRPNGVPAASAVRLHLGRAESWGSDTLSMDEALLVARALSELVSASRPLESRDLEPPESAGASAVDVTELSARVEQLVAAFQAAHRRLETLVANPREAPVEQLRTALLALTYFDVSAVPVDAISDQPSASQALLDQAAAVHAELSQRLRQLQRLREGVDLAALSVHERLKLENSRVAIVLGRTFRVVPRVTPPNAADLNQALSAPDRLLAGDSLAPLTWIRQIARVRSGVAALNDVLTFTQSIHPTLEPGLRVLQLPHRDGDRWSALPFGADRKPSQAALSVVLQVPPGFPKSIPAVIAGLMIDEWNDVIPRLKEQSGLAFHFDAPGSRPPQAMLLAVPSPDQSLWDIETLEAIVTETLELAKLRMVTVPQLDDQVSQFLPALYFGLNDAGDTVSTDFRPPTTRQS